MMTMSNNKKLSSIESFAKKLAEQGLLVYKDYENLVAYQQAKAKHKDEIINTWMDGDGRIPEIKSLREAEHYYEETFGGNSEQ